MKLFQLELKGGNQLKEYEIYSDIKTPICSKTILRLDGRSFHTLSSKLNLLKPYDDKFSSVMSNVSLDIFKEFSPAFIYTFSDEINILLDDILFSGRIEKLNSVFSSFASSSFTSNLNKYFDTENIKPIAFDSRIIPITSNEIFKYFKWRQDEAWRNCVNGYGIWALKEEFSDKIANEKIHGLKFQDIHELLFNKGINLNNVPTWQKRGIAVYKNNDDKIIKDLEIPKFNNDFFIR
ncbi:guanylyltransferase [Methanobrevibacter sp. OttesenSCG-928-K11]|nr:guanylyltransferase [Methanobrevibacter sp. OttesenSCG-928-K11]MDL2270855.1 guanylyltransferase [Methanobrevibacter sp. OttesenSCG-928-I08]